MSCMDVLCSSKIDEKEMTKEKKDHVQLEFSFKFYAKSRILYSTFCIEFGATCFSLLGFDYDSLFIQTRGLRDSLQQHRMEGTTGQLRLLARRQSENRL